MGISRSFSQLAGKIHVVAASIPGSVSVVVRKVGLAVDQVAVTSTPVDTGRARSNWIVTFGAPTDDERGENEWDRGGNVSLQQAQSAIDAYDVSLGDLFITNNVPYIERLENGWSAQAPSGMLAGAVQAGVLVARGEAVKIRT